MDEKQRSEDAKQRLEIAKLMQASFFDRRKLQWQLLLAYWTTLVLITSAVLTGSIIAKGAILCVLLSGLVFLLVTIVYFCIIPIQRALDIDSAFFLFHLNKAEGISIDRPIPDKVTVDLRWAIGVSLLSALFSASTAADWSAAMVPANPATSVFAACALLSSTLITASTVTASTPLCQQSKSVTMLMAQ